MENIQVEEQTQSEFAKLSKFIINQLPKKCKPIDPLTEERKYLTVDDAYRVAEVTSRYQAVGRAKKHSIKINANSPALAANTELLALINEYPELADFVQGTDPGEHLHELSLKTGPEASALLAANPEVKFLHFEDGYSVHKLAKIIANYEFYQSKARRNKFPEESAIAMAEMEKFVRKYGITGRFVFNAFTGASKKPKQPKVNTDFLDNYGSVD